MAILFNPAVNSTYSYTILDEQLISQYAGMEKMGENKNRTTVRLNFSFADPKDGLHSASVRFDSMRMEICMLSPTRDTVKNGKWQTDNTFAKILDAFKDAQFELEINDYGRIVKMEGYELFRNRLIETIKQYPQKKYLLSSHDTLFDEEYFQSLFSSILSTLPTSLRPGTSSWIQDETVNIGVPFVIEATYHVTDSNQNEVFIHGNANVNTIVPINAENLQMTGTFNSRIELDRRSAMMLCGDKQTNLTSSIQVGKNLIQTDCFRNVRISLNPSGAFSVEKT